MEGSKDMATNIGFRMRGARIVTYKQQKLGVERQTLGAATRGYTLSQLSTFGWKKIPVANIHAEGELLYAHTNRP